MKLTKKQSEQICKKLKVNLISFKHLGTGAHNVNYVLDTSGGKFVVRIQSNDSDRISQEYKFLKKLKGKFGPKVYFFDKTKRIIPNNYFIEDFFEGNNYPKSGKKLMGDVAKLLKKLHFSSSQPVTKNDLIYTSLNNYFKDYMKEYNKLKISLKERAILNKVEKLFISTQEICKKNDKIFKKRKKKYLIHGNIDPEHVIYTKKGIKLIDWEFTRYGLPESDLTFFVHLYTLKDSEITYFLEKYRYPKSKRKEFDILLLLHHVGLLNWALERIKEIGEGKIYKDLKSSSFQEMKKEISLHLRRGNEILELLI